MSSTSSRHVFIWTLPAAVLLIGFWWYRKKRAASDPGGTSCKPKTCIDLRQELLNSGESIDHLFSDTVSSNSCELEVNSCTLHNKLDTTKNIEHCTIGYEESIAHVKKILVDSEKPVSQKVVNVNPSLSEIEYKFSKVTLGKEVEKKQEDSVSGEAILEDSGIEEAKQEESGIEETIQEDSSIKEEKEEGLCSTGEEGLLIVVPSCSESGTLISGMARKSSLEVSVESKPVEEEVVIKDVASLELEGTHSIESAAKAEEGNQAERDSANHSPADVMLASPSMSNCSDVQSEGSSDSGKGCSDVATPPSRTPANGSSVSGDLQMPSVFEFLVPQGLVGRLIGRHGCFVQQIKAKTRANIFIKKHPETQRVKVCAIEGTATEIESALAVIREKFPARKYPEVTLEQVCFVAPPSTFPVIPDHIQLNLIEGVTNDVILSSLVTPVHFFLQHPTHPTFPSLNRLNSIMNLCYNEPNIPGLLQPLQASIICAAPTIGGWYRAQVVSVDSEMDTCEVKFIDYGGYLTIESSLLKQIRSDFMNLPFQAAECYLASLCPVEGSDDWSQESIAGMEDLTHGQVLQAHVCGYAEDGNPFVYLYSIHGSTVIFVNEELVNRGLAQWWSPPEEEETV